MSSDDVWDLETTAPRGRPSARDAAHRSGLTGVEDSTYDPAKFYVASTNSHDHDEVMRIKVPKWMMVYLQDLVRDPRLPAYRSVHDVIRDALVHRVKHLHDHGITDSDTDWIEREVLKGALNRIESRRLDKVENVESVRVTLGEALKSRDGEELEMAVAVAQGIAEHIGEPYASDIRVMIGQVFSDAQNYRNVPADYLFGQTN